MTWHQNDVIRVHGRKYRMTKKLLMGSLVQTFRVKNLACLRYIQRSSTVNKYVHALASDYVSSKFEKRETAYNLWTDFYKNNIGVEAAFFGTLFFLTEAKYRVCYGNNHLPCIFTFQHTHPKNWLLP